MSASAEVGAPLSTPVVAMADEIATGAAAADGRDTPDEEVKLNMAAEKSEDYIVRIRNVHKTYLLGIEGVPALRGVSLNIRRGEFVMIIGKSGSGKTTMLNIIGTIDTPTRGDLHLCGRHITSKTTDFELAHTRLRSLGFVFQTFNLLPTMSALENVEMPMVLGGMPGAERRSRAERLLKRVGMGDRLGHTPSQLSGGEQQRVTIARALGNQPELLLLDEPTGDLDTKNSDIVMRLLTDLNAEGVTCVMVTHDVGLRHFAHRVVHMLDGKVQRVHTIPKTQREEALAELRESTAHVFGDSPSADPAAAVAAATAEAMKNTRVRKPGFYSRITETSA